MTVTPRSFARLSRTATRTARTDGLVHRLDRDLGEAPGERGLGLEPGLVLLRGRRADAGDLAAGEGRLERLGEVPDRRRGQLVDLVEEDDDRRVADLDEEVAEELGLRLDRRRRATAAARRRSGSRGAAPGPPRRRSAARGPRRSPSCRSRPGPAGAGCASCAAAAPRRSRRARARDRRSGPASPSRASPTRSRPNRASVGVEDARAAHSTVVATASSRPTRILPDTIARAIACSRRSIALSGNRPFAIERSAKSSRTSRASSSTLTPRPFASASRTLMRIGRVAALSSSATLTVVKRRASASSSAIVVRYSSGVVAPMTAMSPRARAGFSASPALTPPSLRPRLASRWISSRNRMIPGWLASATTWAIRSSNWPRYCVPALSEASGSSTIRAPTQRGRDAPGDDPLGEALDDRGLADAGRSQQDGVALGAADEDLDHPGRLVLAADRRAGGAPRRRASSGPGRAGRGAAWGAGRPPWRPEPRPRSRPRLRAAPAGSRRAVGRSHAPRAGPPHAAGRRATSAVRRDASASWSMPRWSQSKARSSPVWSASDAAGRAGRGGGRGAGVFRLGHAQWTRSRSAAAVPRRHRASVPSPSIGEPCVSLARTRSMYACDLSISVESAVTVFCIVSSAATLNVSISSIVA